MGGVLRVLLGSAVGGVAALLALGVGLSRAGVSLLSGGPGTPLTADDTRMLAFYVGGFVIAGALVGALRPDHGRRARGYAVFCLGGAVVMLAICVADRGSPAALHGFDVAMVTFLGPLLGAAFAHGWFRASE
jgi:peptidoglycan/LPS O-acetylase OafA/YrhL